MRRGSGGVSPHNKSLRSASLPNEGAYEMLYFHHPNARSLLGRSLFQFGKIIEARRLETIPFDLSRAILIFWYH